MNLYFQRFFCIRVPWQNHYTVYCAGTYPSLSISHIYTSGNNGLYSLQNGMSHLTVRINQWTEVSTLMKLNTQDITEVILLTSPIWYP